MKKYDVRVNLIASFFYPEIKAKSKKEAEVKALEMAEKEYNERGLDYPVFEVDELPK